MLQDLLPPYSGEKRASADHASTSGSRRGTDTTRPDSTRGREVPDHRLTDVEDSADNTASILQSIARVMRKRAGGAYPPTSKRQRLDDADNDTLSEAQSVELQPFDPSLDKEDKEEFKFDAPDRVGSYLATAFQEKLV